MRDDPAAVTAWRDARAAWKTLQPITTLRTAISEHLELSPTKAEMRQHLIDHGTDHEVSARNATGALDTTIAFAASDNWSFTGRYLVEKRPGADIDWFALAASGGIRLNTPSEVRAKLSGGPAKPATGLGAIFGKKAASR